MIDQIQQEGLVKLIHHLSNSSELWEVEQAGAMGQLHYLWGNAIASYSLYNPQYHTTKIAERALRETYGLDLSLTHTRSKIHGIRDNNRKKIFTFEHMVPVAVQKDLIRQVVMADGGISITRVREILKACDHVVIMTQVENRELERSYRSTIPENCDPYVNPQLRYDVCGIELSDVMISVTGAMMR